MMMALTFTTGVIDAVGFLGFDRVFTGNMTGNVVILGMALAGAEDLPVAGPALALFGFIFGAAMAGLALRQTSRGSSARTTGLFAIVAVVTLSLAVALYWRGAEITMPEAVATTTLLGGAMGIQAATARVIAVQDVTTVVITSAITSLAAETRWSSESRVAATRRASTVVIMLLGAAAGAALLQWHPAAALALAGTIIAAATGAGALHRRSMPLNDRRRTGIR